MACKKYYLKTRLCHVTMSKTVNIISKRLLLKKLVLFNRQQIN